MNDAILSAWRPHIPLREHLLCPFGAANLTPEQRAFNKDMSSVWQCVEWGFCKVVQLFVFVDFKKNVKLFLQPVDRYYFLAHFFTNCHTCLCGSQTSAFFGLNTPTLDEYLSPKLFHFKCKTFKRLFIK